MYRHLRAIKKIISVVFLILVLLLVLYLTSLPFTNVIKKYFWVIKYYIETIFIVTLLAMFPELAVRFFANDNVLHMFSSVFYTYKIQNFLMGMRQDKIEETTKFRIKKAISKSYINVFKREIVFKIKLPNLLAAQEIIMLNRENIREELSNLTNATFAGFERKGKYLILKGRYN
ncbi:MAG: hypothetical protein ACTIC2_07510 [Enterococcus devriesei]|uniref:hypothetical protein n=1 Tax=Enterococcus devriesei TaxID=319970 RepID=UPI003F93B597